MGMWGWGWLWMILFWAGVIVLIVWAVGRSAGSRDDRALDILKERFARGEIDRDEFEARRRELERL